MFKGEVTDMIGADLPRMKDFDSVTDVGDGAFQVYDYDSSIESYNEYLAQLEAAGYVKYTENTMGNVLCATYVSDDTVVNVQFGGGDADKPLINVDRSLRVVAEPLENTTLPPLEAPEDAESEVTISKITLMYPHNLCIVIHLSNGHFIVIDSGNNGRQKALSNYLRANSPDADNVIIDAWIFTHFHQDHIGGFVDYMSDTSLSQYVTIKNIVYNFPEKLVLDTAPGITDKNNVQKWNGIVESTGATVYQARTGQKYYFGNAEVEILWTFEDIMPHNIITDRSNPTCIGFTVSIAGQKLMVTGDSSDEELGMAYRKFGDYLRCDFVQLSHHGKGDKSSPETFYRAVNAEYVLHPNPTASDTTYGYGEDWAVKNAKKAFHSGKLGTVTIPLPYAGDDNYTTTKK